MGAGLHGENGLDPDTSIHLLQKHMLYRFLSMEWRCLLVAT